MSTRLGHLLRDERRSRGESQRTCAPRFGISQSAYSLWESGINNPAPHQYETVASFLGLDIDEIWGLINDPEAGPATGAEITQRIDRLEAEATGIKRELADMRRERADMQRALDKITKLLEPPATRRPR